MKKKSLSSDDVVKLVEKNNVKYIKLKFMKVDGIVKSFEVSSRILPEIFERKKLFAYEGLEESDMYLKPDSSTFIILPSEEEEKTGRMICDLYRPDNLPFEECPRSNLKRIINEISRENFSVLTGPEAEFFLFPLDESGEPVIKPYDRGGYMDIFPSDRGEKIRREIISYLEKIGINFEGSHHEIAKGQYEINFSPSDPLNAADNFSIFRTAVRKIAYKNKAFATFMPKPLYGMRGSGFHINLSLSRNGKNLFHDSSKDYGLSSLCLYYLGGLLHYAREYTAITNPLINSYKRLVPYHVAPVYINWAMGKRTPMVRVPSIRGNNTRLELRSPDPSCNPYLALSVILKAGFEGIKNKINPPGPLIENIYKMTEKEIKEKNINSLPSNLFEALEEMSRSEFVHSSLGGSIFKRFIRMKFQEWNDYNEYVHPWELRRYLAGY